MATSERFGVSFKIRQGPAGSHYLELAPERQDYREFIEAESVHFLLRDGVEYAALEQLVRELNDSVESVSIRKL